MSDIQDIIDKLPSVFNADAAKGVNAVFQYEITGEGGGSWYVTVNDGTFEVKEGTHPSPSVTMKLDTATYKAMAAKQLGGIQAYMSGKLKVTGNLMIAQKFQQIFPM